MSRKISEFTLGSFNLYNLSLPQVAYYPERSYTEEAYQKKLIWIGKQLDRMQADIVGFQEIFHKYALKDALQKSTYLDGAYHVICSERKDTPSVGLASRFPISDFEEIIDYPLALEMDGVTIPLHQFKRPILKAKVNISDDLSITVFVVHMKSKRPDIQKGEDPRDPIHRSLGKARSLIRRTTEALAIRKVLVDELRHGNQPVILLGDVNDTGQAVSSQIVSGEQPLRFFPTAVKKKLWDILLYQVKDIQARNSMYASHYTHIHNGHHEVLDHIMVSQELVFENPERIGRISHAKVFNDHLVDETLGEERIPEWKSDHGQIVAKVVLRKGK
ncbi:MAG: endonuclease/exonuclease/phosphatase family protein [Bacteroidota bacterium]